MTDVSFYVNAILPVKYDLNKTVLFHQIAILWMRAPFLLKTAICEAILLILEALG